MRVIIIPLLAIISMTMAQETNSEKTAHDVLKAAYKRFLDRSKDVSMGHTFVPSKKKPQGEIQLFKRGRAWVIQTVIYTRYPSRFMKEMTKMEAKAWPDKQAVEKAYSDRYLKDLDTAFDVVKEAYAKNKPKDKLKTLLVEIILSPKHAFAAFSTVKLRVEDGRRTVVDATPISFTPLSHAYVRRGLELLSQDAFGYSPETAKEVFQMFPEPVNPDETP